MPAMEDLLRPPEHDGAYFVATSSSVGVYPDTNSKRKEKLGYLRRGGRVPVVGEPIKNDDCSRGWYSVLGGGYVCGNDGTTNPDDPKAKLATTEPDLGEVLPYRYARNAKNGTPLYKSVPTREQMLHYETYLNDKSKDGIKAKSTAAAEQPPPANPEVDAGAPPEKPWWQRDDADDHLHKVKLTQLADEADEVIAQRMVKGFYVAIDRVFKWNDRSWYKTTRGLVAPADRFWMTDASEFSGVALDKEHPLPIGWVYGWSKERSKYQIDPETKQAKPSGTVKHFEFVTLTGDELKVGKTTYVAANEGFWMKKDQLRIANTAEIPADLAPDERWIDVNLSSQTLVAYIGKTPVFATLVSSGKESKIKDKDHSTPRGQWRVREKHLTTTMDGDGTAAGDLPYSIEDVPYVMYFHKAYALHGAFWHRNYGVRMSHGCINLAPLDAKRLFYFASPETPIGWHGSWAREGREGTRVVVHD